MRALFVSGEVAPFTKENDISRIVRMLPEQLHESGEYEIRIMMPRYGIISERRNKLHEVIRLSGTEINVGGEKQTLKVKVASIPGIRLQVYFMDNVHFFKRKGILQDRDGKVFEDNAERSLYFGRAVLETIRNLGWNPDIVHSFGWAGAMIPTLLDTVYKEEPLFQNSRTVFTPDGLEAHADFTANTISGISIGDPGLIVGKTPTEIGVSTADGVIFPAHISDVPADHASFDPEPETWLGTATEIYEQVAAVIA
ncbi:MAG: glycogen synthase [Rhodothermales bacterium]|nr:glycogen synthase [Rhodothermales bacterium]